MGMQDSQPDEARATQAAVRRDEKALSMVLAEYRGDEFGTPANDDGLRNELLVGAAAATEAVAGDDHARKPEVGAAASTGGRWRDLLILLRLHT